MLEGYKTPLTLAVMARAEELAPNAGDRYETDRLIRVKNVSGCVFTQYELYRVGVLAPIAKFGDNSPPKDRNWWLASQLLDLDTAALQNPKDGDENAASNIEDLQSLIDQIHSIQSNHPNCDVTTTIDSDGSLSIAAIITRGGNGYDYPTTITIIDLAEAAEEQTPATNPLTLEDQIEAIKEQYKHCDIEVRIAPDGKLRILSVNARQGTSVFHDNPTVVTIVNCDPPKVNQCSFNEGAKPIEPTMQPIQDPTRNLRRDLFLCMRNATNPKGWEILERGVFSPAMLRKEGGFVVFDLYGEDQDYKFISHDKQITLEFAVELFKGQMIAVGDTVEVCKDDPMDDRAEIAKELRWQIGEQFVVAEIQEFPWGVFYADGQGHNLHPRRAKLVRKAGATKPVEPTQEQLKGLFEHLSNLSQDSEVLTRLTIAWDLSQEMGMVFSCKPKAPFDWEIVVKKGATGKYHCSTPFEFNHTCKLLGYTPTVEESQQQFVSIPVSEFEEIKSQIKELIELNETRKSETEQLRKWLERLASALQMK